MSLSVSFINSGAIIRVQRSDGTSGYVNKSGLNVIKNNDRYFILQNDSFKEYFTYDNVASPSSTDLDDLLATLVSYITPIVQQQDSSAPSSESSVQRRDLFGTQIITMRRITMNIKSTFGLSTLRDRVSEQAGGSVTNPVGNPEYDLNVSTDGGVARLQTRERGEYVAGITAEIGIGVRASDDSYSGNQLFRWGYFDDSDGFFFQKDASGLSIRVLRDGITMLSASQNAWNVDRLDGTGPSGSTLRLARGNIFQIQHTWYGYGAISFKVVITNGGKQFVQTVHTYAPDGNTSIRNPNLPITVILSNENVTDPANTTPLTAHVAGRQYSIIGNPDVSTKRFTSTYVLDAYVQSGNGFVSVLNVKRKPGYVGNPIQLTGISITSSGPGMLQFRLNGVDESQASYGDIPDTINTETALQQDTSASSVTGGVVINSALFDGGDKKNEERASAFDFNVSLEDDDVFSVVIRPVTNNITCSVIMQFSEAW